MQCSKVQCSVVQCSEVEWRSRRRLIESNLNSLELYGPSSKGWDLKALKVVLRLKFPVVVLEVGMISYHQITCLQ